MEIVGTSVAPLQSIFVTLELMSQWNFFNQFLHFSVPLRLFGEICLVWPGQFRRVHLRSFPERPWRQAQM